MASNTVRSLAFSEASSPQMFQDDYKGDDLKERYISRQDFRIPRRGGIKSSVKSSGCQIARDLASPQGSDTILKTFKKYLKKSDSGACLRATAHGSSGYTLLGNGPIKAFGLHPGIADDRDQQVGIVLKWIPRRAAKDERACNELAEAFGLDVPVMQSVSEETSALFISPTKRQKPSFTETPFQLIAMNRIDGMNLSQLCLSGQIFSLKPAAWSEMMYQFGHAAMLDLFSGNFDRFLRFQMNDKGVYEFSKDPEANGGNVMVHTTPQRGNIASVSFIDNTSLAPPSKPETGQEDAGDFGFSIFGSDEPAEETVDPKTPPKTPEIQSEDPSIVKGLNAFFVSTTKELERDSKGLADHITAAVKNSILKTVKEEVDSVSPLQIFAIENALARSNQNLREGLLHGLLRLREPGFQEKALSIGEASSKSLKELVRLNIMSLNDRLLDLSSVGFALEQNPAPLFQETPAASASVGSLYSTSTVPTAPPFVFQDPHLLSTSVGSLAARSPSLFAGSTIS